MTALIEKKCRTCQHYFENDPDNEKGICKWKVADPFPIQTLDALQQPQITVIMIAPQVTVDEFCGQWASRQLAN